MTIGERIAEERKFAGLTQKELGAETGIDPSTIRKYESGRLNPKIETIKRIAEVLNINWYVLLGEDDDLQGLVKAVDSVEYDPEKERPMVDVDGNLYLQDLKTLDDLKDQQFRKDHAGHENCSHLQITDIERKRRYLDELFFCLNDSGQNLLTEMAKAICMLDNYRIQVLSLSGFLTYEKTIADKLSPPSPLSDDKK